MSNTHASETSKWEAAGLWEPWYLRDKLTNEELMARFLTHNRIFRHLDVFDQWEALLNLGVRGIRMGKGAYAWNKIQTGFLQDNVGARLVNGHTSNEDGVIRYMAVGTNNQERGASMTQLNREIYRDEPLTKKNTGPQQKFILKLDFDDANPGVSTTIAAGSWSTTVFEVASATGLNVGDALRVNTTPVSETRITAIDGVEITVDATQPLKAIPTESLAVDLMIGEVATFGNQDASSTPNSGTPYSCSKLRIYNDSDLAYFIKSTFIGTAA